MQPDLQNLKRSGLLVLLCLVFYVPGLTTLPPVDRDEARFAQATRQMLETRDFVRIRFQEEPRHKKPIGIYWLQAAVVELTSASDTNKIWPYRLPSLLGAILAVLFTFVFGKHLFDERTAFWGAVLVASCLLLVVEAHMATTDAALLATVVVAQGVLGILYVRKGRGGTIGLGLAVTFWTAQGLGILIKGPMVPLVSFLTVIGLIIMDRKVSYLRALRPALGIAWMAAIVSPWAIAVSLATKGTFFTDAVRSDLLPKLISGHEGHGFPPGFYLLLVTLTFWPGSLFLWPALRRAWKHRASAGERFCLAWIVPTWLFLELIPTKLLHYVLPTYPALALLTASLILGSTTDVVDWSRSVLARVGIGVWALISLVLAAVIVAVPVYFTGRFALLTLWPAGAAICISFLVVWKALRSQVVAAAFYAVLMATLVLAPTLHVILPTAEGLWPSRSVARIVERYSQSSSGSIPVVAASEYHEPSLVFLLGTQTKLVSPAEAASHLHQRPNSLALINDKDEESFFRTISSLNESVHLLESIHAFNYSNGRWLNLRLYSKEPKPLQ